MDIQISLSLKKISLCLLSLVDVSNVLTCTEESLWEAIWYVIAQYVLSLLDAKYMHSINDNHLLLLCSDTVVFCSPPPPPLLFLSSLS